MMREVPYSLLQASVPQSSTGVLHPFPAGLPSAVCRLALLGQTTQNRRPKNAADTAQGISQVTLIGIISSAAFCSPVTLPIALVLSNLFVPVCTKRVQDSQAALCCDYCTGQFHHGCVHLSLAQYSRLGSTSDPWLCLVCSLPQFLGDLLGVEPSSPLAA